MSRKGLFFALVFLLGHLVGCEGSSAPPISVQLFPVPQDGVVVSGSHRLWVYDVDGEFTEVQFLLDDQPLGRELTAPPWEAIFDTTALPDGAHQVSVVVRDATGQRATSQRVIVVKNNL